MKTAVITVAGVSSRFNRGIAEKDKCLKAIYRESEEGETLLLHLLNHCQYADKIIVVGGYKFNELEDYIKKGISPEFRKKIVLIDNPYYKELSSGYSLYLGLQEAFKNQGIEEILFVEGDLDIDRKSFKKVIEANADVLTYNNELIYAEKAVIFYQDKEKHYHYLFNAEHGLLRIDEPFSCIFNSGQLWKFIHIEVLKKASQIFFETNREKTNLAIIQEYIDRVSQKDICVLGLERWVNCNTREDFHQIKKFWEDVV